MPVGIVAWKEKRFTTPHPNPMSYGQLVAYGKKELFFFKGVVIGTRHSPVSVPTPRSISAAQLELVIKTCFERTEIWGSREVGVDQGGVCWGTNVIKIHCMGILKALRNI